MQMRYEYETGPDRNSGTGRLPSDYQEVSVQSMTPGAWERTLVLARRDGLGEAEMAGLAIGCPVHGNASMDWDAGELFCHRCVSYQMDTAQREADAVQDARTAALAEMAAESGIEPDGGVRPCEPNVFGFCRTCGADMEVSA